MFSHCYDFGKAMKSLAPRIAPLGHSGTFRHLCSEPELQETQHPFFYGSSQKPGNAFPRILCHLEQSRLDSISESYSHNI